MYGTVQWGTKNGRTRLERRKVTQRYPKVLFLGVGVDRIARVASQLIEAARAVFDRVRVQHYFPPKSRPDSSLT